MAGDYRFCLGTDGSGAENLIVKKEVSGQILQ
jgi:hypothetical protein